MSIVKMSGRKAVLGAEQLPWTGPWQHDLFRGDFTPYDPNEIELFKAAIKDMASRRK